MKIPQREREADRSSVDTPTRGPRRPTAPLANKNRPDFVARGARYKSGVLRAHALDTRCNPLHFVFAVELQLFQLDFFQEVFRTEVGLFEDALQLCVVLLMLL
jgi:hypothetical protein